MVGSCCVVEGGLVFIILVVGGVGVVDGVVGVGVGVVVGGGGGGDSVGVCGCGAVLVGGW